MLKNEKQMIFWAETSNDDMALEVKQQQQQQKRQFNWNPVDNLSITVNLFPCIRDRINRRYRMSLAEKTLFIDDWTSTKPTSNMSSEIFLCTLDCVHYISTMCHCEIAHTHTYRWSKKSIISNFWTRFKCLAFTHTHADAKTCSETHTHTHIIKSAK